MTIITLHHLFFGHCVNLSVIVLDLGIFLRERSPKQSPPISHNDLKKDGAQLLLSNYELHKGQKCVCLPSHTLCKVGSVGLILFFPDIYFNVATPSLDESV